MPIDRIEKTNNELFRVNETKDSLEEDGKKQSDTDEDGDKDNFDKLSDKTDWNILFNKKQLWQRDQQVRCEDISKIKFLGVNLKTDPSLLKIRIFLKDGSMVPTAFLSIPRAMGLQIQHLNRAAMVSPQSLTQAEVLRITVPVDEQKMDDEITKITAAPQEHSFSKTLRRMVSKRSLLQRFGVQDPVSLRLNREVLVIYITVILLIIVLGFGVTFILF